MQKQFPFWVLTLAVLIALIVPVLIQDGMFMDGLLYACISNNLAHGFGSFWFPHYSKTIYVYFDQQPPLGFGIESLFFRVFGSSMYVERGYCFLTAIINACLIIVLWRQIHRENKELKQMGWLPVLLWITVPVCFWAYSNNILENTMSIFDLMAVIFIVQFFQTRKFIPILFAGIFIFLASLTKGIQGIFPMAAIFFWWAINKNISFSKMLSYSLSLLLIPSIIYFLLLQQEAAYKSLTTYMQHRVLNSIEHENTGSGRFYLVGRLLFELLPMLIFTGIIFFLNRRKKSSLIADATRRNDALFFLLIGLSASLPLMITLEQRGFYLVTSLPYFALAAAGFMADYIYQRIEKIEFKSRLLKILKVSAWLLLTAAITFSMLQIGKVSRDKEAIHDVHLIGREIPSGTMVGATRVLWMKWSFSEYLIRHYYICVEDKITTANDYVILESGTYVPDSIHIKKVNIPTIRYHLYKKVK